MNPTTGDIMFRKQLAQQGYSFVDIPVNHQAGPALIAVRTNGFVTFIDSQNASIFQHLDSVPNSHGINHTQIGPNMNTGPILQNLGGTGVRFANHASANTTTNSRLAAWNAAHLPRDSTYQPLSGLKWARSENALGKSQAPGTFSSQPNVERFIPIETVRANQQKYSMFSNNNEREKFIPIHALKSQQSQNTAALQYPVMMDIDPPDVFNVPEIPAPEDVDTMFNDALYESLQGDILPRGANPLDDYLNQNIDSRARIYLDSALDNQGCHCEHSDLDKYINKNKDVHSAISLRATMSDEHFRKVPVPVETKPFKDKMQTAHNYLENFVRGLAEMLSNDQTPKTSPWNASSEADTMNIS